MIRTGNLVVAGATIACPRGKRTATLRGRQFQIKFHDRPIAVKFEPMRVVAPCDHPSFTD
jgi:hypothetical protein